MRKVLRLLFISILTCTLCLVIKVDAATTINPHIKAVYEYNQDGSGTGVDYTGCLGGAEAGCSNIISSKDGDSTYEKGTIIKYEVKDGEERYFNVIHDDGTILTLQERQSTVSINNPWYGISSSYTNENGPALTSGYVLYEVEQATSDWAYVNDQTYSIGDNTTTLGYSGCSAYNNCNTSKYTLNRTAKARMITMQELTELGCTETNGSCMNFVHNYLSYSTSFGASFYGESGAQYWIMNADSESSDTAWLVACAGAVFKRETYDTYSGGRAVVVIDKAEIKSTDTVSDGSSNNETTATSEENKSQGETVKTEDTLKMSYFGYIMGLIAIVAGTFVIYDGIERKYENKE